VFFPYGYSFFPPDFRISSPLFFYLSISFRWQYTMSFVLSNIYIFLNELFRSRLISLMIFLRTVFPKCLLTKCLLTAVYCHSSFTVSQIRLVDMHILLLPLRKCLIFLNLQFFTKKTSSMLTFSLYTYLFFPTVTLSSLQISVFLRHFF
jgi:hypothetical protein